MIVLEFFESGSYCRERKACFYKANCYSVGVCVCEWIYGAAGALYDGISSSKNDARVYLLFCDDPGPTKQ